MKTAPKQHMAFLSVLLALLLLPAAKLSAQDQWQNYAMRQVAEATVMVCVETGEEPNIEISWGSGMIIAPGLVVTNAHVVNEKLPARIYIQNRNMPRTPVSIVAKRYESNEFTPAKIVEYIADTLIENAKINGVRLAKQPNNFDMAVLSFTPSAATPALAFNQDVTRGESVVAAGYPGREAMQSNQYGGYGYTPGTVAPIVLTSGMVTSLGTLSPQIIVHNARCSTGNSGGPLVNSRGEIVGMQTWTSIPGSVNENMSLAIGARDMVRFLQQNGIQPTVAGYPQSSPAREPPYDVSGQIIAHANAGDADFMALAGLLSFLGECGFAQDARNAAAYLQRAVSSSPYGQFAYLYKAGLAAVLLQSSELWQPDYAESLLVSANSSPAAGSSEPDPHLLAYEAALRTQGKAFGIKPDANRSLRLAEQAIAGSFAFPFALAGYHYYFGDTYAGKDHEKALRYAREAASNDITEGISLLAHLYYDSDAVPRTAANRQTARRLAREAARQGDPWAFGLLATMYYDSGEDKVEALKLALLGACHGNRLAILCLGKMAWDCFASNTSDFSQAVRAWAYIDLAGREGVGPIIRNTLSSGRVFRSARDIVDFFPPAERRRILDEGRREQEALMARKDYRPRIPCLEDISSALAMGRP